MYGRKMESVTSMCFGIKILNFLKVRSSSTIAICVIISTWMMQLTGCLLQRLLVARHLRKRAPCRGLNQVLRNLERDPCFWSPLQALNTLKGIIAPNFP
jgi:hypothetical protein